MNQPIPITFENRDKIPFPCWLYNTNSDSPFWWKCRDAIDWRMDIGSATNYLPDQPDRPTCVPEGAQEQKCAQELPVTECLQGQPGDTCQHAFCQPAPASATTAPSATLEQAAMEAAKEITGFISPQWDPFYIAAKKKRIETDASILTRHFAGWVGPEEVAALQAQRDRYKSDWHAGAKVWLEAQHAELIAERDDLKREVAEIKTERDSVREELAEFASEKWDIAALNSLYYDNDSHLIDFIITHCLSEVSKQLGGHGWDAYESDGGLKEAIGYEFCTLLRKAGVMDDEDNTPTHVKLCARLTAADEQMRALKRIAEFVDAPAVNATGEWQTGLYCGVEDRDCRDRYEGADYGYVVGVERALEWASNEAKFALATQPKEDKS